MRRIRYGWAAAAAVILVVGVAGVLYRKGNKTVTDTKSEGVVATAAPRKDVLRAITNSSLKPQSYSLPDGSQAKLAGNSSISFHDPFIDNRRDIYLNSGEAVFTVAKDKARPFAVHSRGISTTALGTVFSVDDRGGLIAMVHLFSGRVVVKKEAKEGKSFKDVYLLPGEQLQLNTNDYTVQVKRDEPKASVAERVDVKPQPQSQVLQFNERPLTEIFDLLHQQFGVVISYDAAGLKNMEFSGVFNGEKETVESFLSTLCDLNELTLKKTGEGDFSVQTK